MKQITKEQYEVALGRIEEILPLVTDDMPVDNPLSQELMLLSDMVISYEKLHYPIARPTTHNISTPRRARVKS